MPLSSAVALAALLLITARITHIEVHHGYLVAEWGAGARSAIMMDKRALGTYRVGDTILLDDALRPLGRR